MSFSVRFDVLTAVLLKIRVSGSADSDHSRGRRASIWHCHLVSPSSACP